MQFLIISNCSSKNIFYKLKFKDKIIGELNQQYEYFLGDIYSTIIEKNNKIKLLIISNGIKSIVNIPEIKNYEIHDILLNKNNDVIISFRLDYDIDNFMYIDVKNKITTKINTDNSYDVFISPLSTFLYFYFYSLDVRYDIQKLQIYSITEKKWLFKEETKDEILIAEFDPSEKYFIVTTKDELLLFNNNDNKFSLSKKYLFNDKSISSEILFVNENKFLSIRDE